MTDTDIKVEAKEWIDWLQEHPRSTTPAIDYIQGLLNIIEQLEKERDEAIAVIRKVVEEGVRIRSGKPVLLGKVEECDHNRYGYEDCENCIDDYLLGFLTVLESK